MRAWSAVFVGAFLIALIYSTKSESGPMITMAPKAESGVVAGTLAAPAPALPGDVESLRAQGPIIPVAGVVAKDLIDSFNDMRGGTRRHSALDIMAARNTPVLSATAGKVLKLHSSVAGGLTIYASDPTSRFVLMYGHLDSYRPGLKEGSSLQRGEIRWLVWKRESCGPSPPLSGHAERQHERMVEENSDQSFPGVAFALSGCRSGQAARIGSAPRLETDAASINPPPRTRSPS